jgi:phage baseplate assembly protein W
MTRSIYRGFSTASGDPSKGFLLTDVELVKQDLLNHIYTLPGERPMLPDFGTRITLLTFEPLDKDTISVVETDLRKVFDYDPRVEVLSLSVKALPDNNTIVAFADLRYIELNVTETLHLEFPVGS